MSVRRQVAIPLAAMVAGLLAADGAHASPTLGQVDDFQDGTTQNWNGASGFFSNVAGGQGGAGDLYLEVTSRGGNGPGSRIGTFNDNQWSGDYLSAGVTAVEVDLANFGLTDLDMRVVLFGTSAEWTSTNSLLVPADGIWRNYTFSLTAADLTLVGGAGPLEDTLAGVERFLFRHQSGPPSGIGGGTPVVGNLGLDNITAIPAPGAWALLGVAALAARRRRRSRSP
jgi:hypothetical protein